MQGWAIEARVLAEDPENGFLPASGEIEYLKEPGGPGIRVDSALYTGMTVTTDYDSLLAKVIGWGVDRPHAIRRLLRALGEFQIAGVPTDLEFLTQIIDSDSFQVGKADTTFLDNLKLIQVRPEADLEKEMALAAALLKHYAKDRATGLTTPAANYWQMTGWREQMRGSG